MSQTTPPSPVPQEPSPPQLDLDYEEAFELTGHGIFNHIVLVACCLIFVYSTLEMAAIAYIITPAECDLKLSIAEKSMINSGIFIGILSTAIIWGSVSDHFGRRKVMLPAIVGAVLTSFLSSLCNSFWTMFPLRIVTGCLVSGASATVFVYLGELHTLHHRAFAITMIMAVTQVVFVVLPIVAWLIIPGAWSFQMGVILVKPWRVFMWMWGLFGLSGAILLFLLPESPDFILGSQGPDRALLILANIYFWNNRKSLGRFPVNSIKNNPNIVHPIEVGLKDTLQLFQSPLRRCFIITHTGMFILFALSYGLYIWIPDFINEMLKDTSLPSSICDLINKKYVYTKASNFALSDVECAKEGGVNTLMYPISMIMETIYMAPFITILIIIDRIDKKVIYVCILCTCAVALVLCCLVPQIVVTIVFVVLGINAFSATTILSSLAVDAFPTSLRSLAMCTMYMTGQVGAVVGNNVISLMHGVFCQVLFILIAVSAAVSAFSLWRFWPDLKQVRSVMKSRNFTY